MGKHRKPGLWRLADWPQEGDFGIFNEATGKMEPYYPIEIDPDDPARGWITPPQTTRFTVKDVDPAVIALFYGEALGTSTPIYDELLAEQSNEDIDALAAWQRWQAAHVKAGYHTEIEKW